METCFAPAERANGCELKSELQIIGTNPIINSLLGTVGGLLAVLNEPRQIIMINDAFLNTLGIKDAIHLFGLRPGEALNCVHADETEGGCGTTKMCSSCGAAISIVASLAGKKPVERKCALKTSRGGKIVELCFSVVSCLFEFQDRRFVLLFLQDITNYQQWAALEHVFFHDISNILMGLSGASELIKTADEKDIRELADEVFSLSRRLSREIEIQRIISGQAMPSSSVQHQVVTVLDIITELRNMFAHHPVAANKQILFPKTFPVNAVTTDSAILLRILGNMLTNALEATESGGLVKFLVNQDDGNISFCVWNRLAIPENISGRIFQRYFSTKDRPGRGLGTYSMKLLGEKFLGGCVDMKSSEENGTVFRISLPL